jgi:hypothetical protein
LPVSFFLQLQPCRQIIVITRAFRLVSTKRQQSRGEDENSRYGVVPHGPGSLQEEWEEGAKGDPHTSRQSSLHSQIFLMGAYPLAIAAKNPMYTLFTLTEGTSMETSGASASQTPVASFNHPYHMMNSFHKNSVSRLGVTNPDMTQIDVF